VIDVENDHNTQQTAQRVARMYVEEVFSGRFQSAPDLTAFPNVNSYDEMYLVGPITIRSTCAHHLQNIRGNCWIGIYPGTNVLGLSKFYRLTEWIASRPQIQEEMTIQIADLVEAETEAEGLAVVVKAEHMCVTHRGVKEHGSDMTTSVLRGVLRDNPETRAEFFRLLQGMKGFSS
jgi:GTP cyclohydrolase I